MHHHAGHVGYASPGTQIDLITPDFEARSGRFKVPAGVPTCETEEHRENLLQNLWLRWFLTGSQPRGSWVCTKSQGSSWTRGSHNNCARGGLVDSGIGLAMVDFNLSRRLSALKAFDMDREVERPKTTDLCDMPALPK
jgi:hypothetical protein